MRNGPCGTEGREEISDGDSVFFMESSIPDDIDIDATLSGQERASMVMEVGGYWGKRRRLVKSLVKSI